MFAAPLNVEIGPDQEWHSAIVQAKGYPPQQNVAQQTGPQQSLPEQAAGVGLRRVRRLQNRVRMLPRTYWSCSHLARDARNGHPDHTYVFSLILRHARERVERRRGAC